MSLYLSCSIVLACQLACRLLRLLREMCSLLGICNTRTTVLHPQSDGMVECCNRTLGDQLATFIQDYQRDWDLHSTLLLMSCWTTVCETTNLSCLGENCVYHWTCSWGGWLMTLKNKLVSNVLRDSYQWRLLMISLEIISRAIASEISDCATCTV